MAKYVVVFRQEGGCDYTIGCGVVVCDDVQATNEEELNSEIERLAEYYGLDNIDTYQVFEVTEIGTPCTDILTELKKKHLNKSVENFEDEQRQLYEKLKQKYR